MQAFTYIKFDYSDEEKEKIKQSKNVLCNIRDCINKIGLPDYTMEKNDLTKVIILLDDMLTDATF